MTPAVGNLVVGLSKAADRHPEAFLLPFWRDLAAGHNIFDSFATAVRSRRQLTYLTIDTTGACDLTCRGMCYYNPKIPLNRQFVSEVALQDAIREAARDLSMRVLAFAGKEPFLNAGRLFSLLESAADISGRTFITGIVTNGRHITRYRDLLRLAADECWLNYIDVSIDSHNAEQHDSFRGVAGTHAMAMEGLRWVHDNLDNVRSTVVSVLRWDNTQGILDLIRFLAPTIKYYQVQPIQPPPYSSIPPLSGGTVIAFLEQLKTLLAGPLEGRNLSVSIELLGIYLREAVAAGLFEWHELREDDNQTIYAEIPIGSNTLIVTCELFPLQAWRLARITYTGAYLAHMHFLQSPDPEQYAVGLIGQHSVGDLFDRAMGPDSHFAGVLKSRQSHDCGLRDCWSNCFGGWNGAENVFVEKGRKLSSQPRLCDKPSNGLVNLQSLAANSKWSPHPS